MSSILANWKKRRRQIAFEAALQLPSLDCGELPPELLLSHKESMSMAKPTATPIAMDLWCDGRRLLFEIVEDGHSVACAISLMALED
ncbi:hypothetical protein [Belnapia moabensis]|uniref:hypothetical protein n=1 Tax=Belnapia moabensis TaxID=365533 RepID=UPI0014704698|nr:hypothetical protein [Belnapia moabensis]